MPILLDSIDPTHFFFFGAAFLVGLALQTWIIRIACRADEQVKNQKAAVWLLIKMCEKQGVQASEIENIREVFKIG